jgi:hypothetical protein
MAVLLTAIFRFGMRCWYRAKADVRDEALEAWTQEMYAREKAKQ